ncbi:MAG: hypothetical protein QXO92_05370, partial [Candidatus Bathyarchaeia archaeon]
FVPPAKSPFVASKNKGAAKSVHVNYVKTAQGFAFDAVQERHIVKIILRHATFAGKGSVRGIGRSMYSCARLVVEGPVN